MMSSRKRIAHTNRLDCGAGGAGRSSSNRTVRFRGNDNDSLYSL